MSSTATEILQDIVSALNDSGLFAEVSLGISEASTAVPRAYVTYEGQDTFLSDDHSASLWVRLRVRVTIRTRSDSRGEGVARAADLYASAAEALLTDAYRTQHCCNLPIGRATEIGRSEITPGIRRPEVEMTFGVRCHFEQEDD